MLEYLKKYIDSPRQAILAGNSVHQDRLFLRREMPKVNDFLHYRIIDVSTFYEVGIRVNPKLVSQRPTKKYNHTAREDILESIQELKWYTENLLMRPAEISTESKPQLPIETPKEGQDSIQESNDTFQDPKEDESRKRPKLD